MGFNSAFKGLNKPRPCHMAVWGNSPPDQPTNQKANWERRFALSRSRHPSICFGIPALCRIAGLSDRHFKLYVGFSLR